MCAACRIADHFETVEQVGERWGMTRPGVLKHIHAKHVPAVQFFAGQFFIPKGSPRPIPRSFPRRAPNKPPKPTILLSPEALARLQANR